MGPNKPLPTVLITGASGFVGRHLVTYLCPTKHVIAFARRTQKAAGIEPHPNLDWILVDIMNQEQLENAFRNASSEQNIDYVFHLAAYYDFGDQIHSEIYEKTNVEATRILLELAAETKIKRFIFTSSVVASNFPEPGEKVTELSLPYADFPYAISKREGERLVREGSKYFPCSIVRLAAVYSDWCEYEPLYNFLKIWLSDRWDASMIPGHGSMAIPYIHISCVITLFDKLLGKSEDLENLCVFLASSDKPVSLLELFSLATHHYYGTENAPVFLPVWFARLGVLIRDLWGRLVGKRPFEKVWMTEYIDKQFPTDCAFTRDKLDWRPKARHHISRRLLHLIENLKTRPDKWHRMNIDRLLRFERARPSLALAEEMVRMHADLVDRAYHSIMHPSNQSRLSYFQSLAPEDLRWYISVIYNHLLTSVRHGDRSIMITFAHDLSHQKMKDAVRQEELCLALTLTRDVITNGLNYNPNLVRMKLLVHDYITLAIQLAIDEIKDVYENIPR